MQTVAMTSLMQHAWRLCSLCEQATPWMRSASRALICLWIRLFRRRNLTQRSVTASAQLTDCVWYSCCTCRGGVCESHDLIHRQLQLLRLQWHWIERWMGWEEIAQVIQRKQVKHATPFRNYVNYPPFFTVWMFLYVALLNLLKTFTIPNPNKCSFVFSVI